MKSVDLNLMVALDLLLEELNVTRAASRLDISQPAMSAQLRKLRLLFGDPLLVPAVNGRGMVMTPRAKEIQRTLRAALTSLHELVDGATQFDPRSSRRTFRILCHDNCATMAGAGLLSRIRAQGAEGLKIDFVSHIGEDMAEGLEAGAIDLAIGWGQGPVGSLMGRKLFIDRLVVAQRQGHPRGTAPFDLETFCTMGHLAVSPIAEPLRKLDLKLAELRRTRRISVSVQNYTLVPEFLVRSDLVCVLPERFLRLYSEGLDIFPLPIAVPEIEVSVYWHPAVHTDPALSWLRQQLFEIAPALAARPDKRAFARSETG